MPELFQDLPIATGSIHDTFTDVLGNSRKSKASPDLEGFRKQVAEDLERPILEMDRDDARNKDRKRAADKTQLEINDAIRAREGVDKPTKAAPKSGDLGTGILGAILGVTVAPIADKAGEVIGLGDSVTGTATESASQAVGSIVGMITGDFSTSPRQRGDREAEEKRAIDAEIREAQNEAVDVARDRLIDYYDGALEVKEAEIQRLRERNESLHRNLMDEIARRGSSEPEKTIEEERPRPCPYPWSLDKRGRRCGGRSAFSRGPTHGYDSSPGDFAFRS